MFNWSKKSKAKKRDNVVETSDLWKRWEEENKVESERLERSRENTHMVYTLNVEGDSLLNMKKVDKAIDKYEQAILYKEAGNHPFDMLIEIYDERGDISNLNRIIEAGYKHYVEDRPQDEAKLLRFKEMYEEVMCRDDRSESGSVQIPIQGQCSGGSCERVDLHGEDGGEKGAGGSGEDPRA